MTLPKFIGWIKKYGELLKLCIYMKNFIPFKFKELQMIPISKGFEIALSLYIMQMLNCLFLIF